MAHKTSISSVVFLTIYIVPKQLYKAFLNWLDCLKYFFGNTMIKMEDHEKTAYKFEQFYCLNDTILF